MSTSNSPSSETPTDPAAVETVPSPTAGAATASPSPRWWKYLGLRRRSGKYVRIVPTRWGWVFITLLVLVVGGSGFAEYSMQPDFCRSCHIMEPYYQAWHASTHKNVPCVDCHFEPGLKNTLYGKFQASSQAVKYITATYGSKPHAEIKDVSCMRSGCHETRLLNGKINWTVNTERGGSVTIRFDHKPHLTQLRRGKQLRCVSCHSQIVQGQHLVVTLDTCFLCHMKGVQHGRNDQTLAGCRSCHEAPSKQIRLTTGMFNHGDYTERGVSCENCHSDVISGDGAVPRQICWSCHNKPDQVARYTDTEFMHKAHVTDHKVECASCHIQIQHHLNAATEDVRAPGIPTHLAERSGACGQCHEQTHMGPESLYRGTGGRGVPDMPSPMSRARVNCIACHQHKEQDAQAAQVTGQTFAAGQDRCNYCHGDKYNDRLEAWKAIIAAKLQVAEVAHGEAEKAIASGQLDAAQRTQVQQWMDDAEHNIRYVKLGHGVHNVNYALALLSVASDNCRKAAATASGHSTAGAQ